MHVTIALEAEHSVRRKMQAAGTLSVVWTNFENINYGVLVVSFSFVPVNGDGLLSANIYSRSLRCIVAQSAGGRKCESVIPSGQLYDRSNATPKTS